MAEPQGWTAVEEPSGWTPVDEGIESHRIVPQGHQQTTFEKEHPTIAGVIKAFGMSPPLPGMPMDLPGSGAMLAPQAVRGVMNAFPKSKVLLKAYDAIKSMIPGVAKAAEAEAPPISSEEYYRGQSRPMPSAEDYYANQSVKAAEAPPTNPAQSAPATPPAATLAPAQATSAAPPQASAAPTATVQPIRPATTGRAAPPEPVKPVEARDIDFQQRYGEQEQPEVAKFLGHEQPATEAPSQPRPASGATAAKSARYADAISKWAKDMGMSPKDIADQWGTTTPEVRGQILLQLKQKGYLGANETIPRTSAQGIVDALKARAATIKPPSGFGMGSMKQYPAPESASPAPSAIDSTPAMQQTAEVTPETKALPERPKVSLFKTEDGREFPQYEGKPLSWVADMTRSEETAGFPKAKAVLRAMRDYRPEQFANEYQQALRGSFDRTFGYNAKRLLNLIEQIRDE